MTGELVEWDSAGLAEWESARQEGTSVIVHALGGFIDAGHAGALLVRRALDESDAVRVATFDVDALLDYRSRRPEMTFSVNAWTEYEAPELVLDMLRDADGRPYLLLHGPEPDVRWEAYVAAVREACSRLGVSVVVAAHGIPMAAPHTRPILATVHGTRPELLPTSPSFFATVTVPASAANLLEYRFAQWGLDAMTIAVHVPHYLSATTYPQAAQEIMRLLRETTTLDLDPARLDDAAAEAFDEIERQVGESEEVRAVVELLERQYDAFLESQEGIFPLDGRLPTAEELGAEFEKYLAERGKDVP